MIYSTFNNNALPLVSKNRLVQLESWGKENNRSVQKAAYKIKQYLMSDQDVWGMSKAEVATFSDRPFLAPVQMVDEMVDEASRLGIASELIAFPDFLFRGDQVSRFLVPITSSDFNDYVGDLDYLLTAPEFQSKFVSDFQKIFEKDGWILYQATIEK